MFFSENLFLEEDELEATDAAPMTDDEIAEAALNGEMNDEIEVNEAADFEIAGLKFDNIMNESWYNLREKMMNVEHIALMKKSKGLYSESEIILSEAGGSFIDAVKNFFVKIGKFIKSLFEKFVNFILGMFTSVTKLRGINIDENVDQYFKNHDEDEKIKVYNFGGTDAFKSAENYITRFETYAKELNQYFEKDLKFYNAKTHVYNTNPMTGGRDHGNFEEIYQKRPSKLKDRNNAKKQILKDFTREVTKDNKPVITKVETKLTKSLVIERWKIVEVGKAIINECKKVKNAALKNINNYIKDVSKLKDKTDAQKELQSKYITELKWVASLVSSLYSKSTSYSAKYFRESVAIVRRVVGGNRAENIKDKFKSMTEGYNFDAYFAM